MRAQQYAALLEQWREKSPLRKSRELSGLQIKQMARLLEVQPKTYRSWESGDAHFQENKVLNITMAFGEGILEQLGKWWKRRPQPTDGSKP